MLGKDDLKAIVDTIYPLIDARAKTTETLMKAEIRSAKEELRTEILASRADAKADTLMLDAKVMRKVQSHSRRLDNLEESTNTPNPDKH